MTFINILVFVGIGFVAGLVLLLIYRGKVLNREEQMQQDAHKRASEAFISGRQAAESAMKDREDSLNERERMFYENEAAFLSKAARLKDELPPMEVLVNVRIAADYVYRSLYHRLDSTCLKHSKIVALQTARELNLRPCKTCRPDDQEYISVPSPTPKPRRNIVPFSEYSEQKQKGEDIHISYRN